MLVVIAILALLAALIMPAISRSLNSARRAQCSANLRQIGNAFMMFTMSDRQQRLPAVLDPSVPGYANGLPWFVAISPYLEVKEKSARELSQTFRCPVYSRLRPELKNTSSWDQLGYGMNYYMVGSPSTGWPWGSGGGTAYRAPLDLIKSPSKTILVADEKSWNWGVHGLNFDGHAYFDEENEEKELRGFRHGKGANYLFVDGHVSFMEPADVEPLLPR